MEHLSVLPMGCFSMLPFKVWGFWWRFGNVPQLNLTNLDDFSGIFRKINFSICNDEGMFQSRSIAGTLQQNPAAHCHILFWSQTLGSGLPMRATFTQNWLGVGETSFMKTRRFEASFWREMGNDTEFEASFWREMGNGTEFEASFRR